MTILDLDRRTVPIICTSQPVAYVGERVGNMHAALNLLPHVKIVEHDHSSYDSAPILVDKGCGRKFEVPDLESLWDLNTETREDGAEWVTERHYSALCPHCGSTADHFSEPMKPYLHNGLGKEGRVRAALFSELLATEGAWFNDRSPDDQQRIVTMLVEGIQGGVAGYSHVSQGAIALTAATAKTVLGLKAHANSSLLWRHWALGFDGVTASAIPVLVELGYLTWATNSPGTNSTSTTIQQEFGRPLTAGFTGGKTWTTEPTAYSILAEFLMSPNGGFGIDRDPLDNEIDCALGEGFGIRLTAPAAVNVRGTMKATRN